jgi:hypothetical protein
MERAIAIWWTWVGEHDQIFWEYFVDTWHEILHDVEEYFASYPRIKKTDEKLKQTFFLKMKKDEQNLFITKSYVSIQILPFHNREVCVNRNTTCSSPRSMFPLKIESIWYCTFSIPFQPVFLFEFNISNLLCLGTFLLLEE